MLLSLENVSFGYDDKLILEGLNLTVNESDRIGLIGKNGIGKSTLLHVLLGKLLPDEGGISKKGGLRIGFLAQNSGLEGEKTVYEEMKAVFADALVAEKKMREIEGEMAKLVNHESAEFRALSSAYARASAVFDAADGYQIDVRIRTVLNGMGFAECYDRVVSTMSGGEKTRLALCRLLLAAPELLVLDEPTNHLDFASLAWLEEYLTAYRGSIIVVSHDRWFLDRTVNLIWELDNRKVMTFRGNYTKYKELKRAYVERQLKEYEKQANRIASMQEYAERNIVRASTSKSAKSRLHQLEHIERIEKPNTTEHIPKFSFSYDSEPVKDVLSVQDTVLSVGEEERVLCKHLAFSLRRGEKLAIIGKNGTGKSTLLKRLLKAQVESDRAVCWGRGVRIGYYDQENLNLNFQNTVLEELWNRHLSMAQAEVRGSLARMLLGEEDMEKPVSVLSGGERAKLGFAILIAERGNVLVLDEPTNHLDLVSREALEEALCAYGGTMIFVSHDRYFLNAVCSRLLEIKEVAPAFFETFEGYLAEQEKERQRIEFEKSVAAEKKNSTHRTAKMRSEEVKKKSRIRALEAEISENEELLSELEAKVSTPEISGDYEKLKSVCEEMERVRAHVETLFEEWSTLSE